MRQALAALLERLGLGPLESCERLSGGASQETWRVVTASGRYALRRGGAGMSALGAGIGMEVDLLRAAAAAQVPVPVIRYVLVHEDGLGAGFLMDWLDGETLGPRIARGEELAAVRPRLARQCGEILARLHAVEPPPNLPARTPEQLVRETWSMVRAYGSPQPMIDYTARWLIDHLPPPGPARLVHGDFRNGNLMVDPTRGVTGVLDWELAHRGDPLRDLGWLCTPSWRFGGEKIVGGFGAAGDLLDGYAAVAGTRPSAESLQFWIVFGAFWWSVGTLTMTQLNRLGADRSIERLAIGRRSSECQADCVNLLIPGTALPLAPAPPEREMPRSDELLAGLAAFLRDDVAAASRGRAAFMAKVGANAAEIVQRELTLGPAAAAREAAGLERLLGHPGERGALRAELAGKLRDGMPLDTPGLAEHLRQSVADRLAIDQPKYPAYATLVS